MSASGAARFSKEIRTGTVTVIVTDLTKAISLTPAMPSANYRVFVSLEGNLAATLWPTAKTTSGFTLNLSVGVVGTIAWMVVED